MHAPQRGPKRSFGRHDARRQCRQDEGNGEKRRCAKRDRCGRNDRRKVGRPGLIRLHARAMQDRKNGRSCECERRIGCERNDRTDHRAGKLHRNAHAGRRAARESRGIPTHVR
ncbi:TPA: hypothetical protein ACK3O9_005883, partial [Burkholderia cepacia]